MKIAKSFLLAGGALFVTAAGAQAADLPVSKAAPVEYVRVCSAQGAGFFYIPGTDTCLKIGGRVRADYVYVQPKNQIATPKAIGNGREKDAVGTHVRAQLEVDARTATDYGTLRAFLRYQIDKNTGNQSSGNGVLVDKAYIQWAGITAGRAQSFFDFYATDLNWSALAGSLGSDVSTNLLAYTATFGSGFSATLSVEDRNVRNVNAAAYNNVLTDQERISWNFEGRIAGQRMPDIVANLRVDQDWGSAQLSGALRQMNSLGNIGNKRMRVNTAYGWAVQGGAKFHLPMIGAGDALWLQAAYADGALSYLGLNGVRAEPGKAVNLISDGYLTNGKIKKTHGWNLTAAGVHYWTPSVRSTLWGSYTNVKYSSAVKRDFAALRDFNMWQVGSALIWSPASKFDVGVEVLYGRLQRKRYDSVLDETNVKRSGSSMQTRLRLQRDF